MSLVVAPRTSIEIGVVTLVLGVLNALMLTSSVVAGAMAVSQRGRVRRSRMPDLVDLNLSRHDMHLDLLDFWSLWELLQLVENDSEIGAWHLLP